MDPKYKKALFCKKFPSECNDAASCACDCEEEEKEKGRKEKAFERAHEIRRFEISLYWQRSLYFWGFQAAFFAAYVLTYDNAIVLSKEEKEQLWLAYGVMLLIAIVGLLISILWHFLAKGSKAWQENWEHHIDQLEDDFTGRLHKTILGNEKDFYSVTKANGWIIFIIGFMWVVFSAFPFSLFCKEKFQCLNFFCCFALSLAITLILAVAFFFLFGWLTKSRFPSKSNFWKKLESAPKQKSVYSRLINNSP